MLAAIPDRSAAAPPRVLIVDDSAVARAVISRAVETEGQFTVAGAVPTIAAALHRLRSSRVDAVLLDLDLPGVGGLDALPEVIAAAGGAKVLVVSSSCADGAQATLRALALGAADTLVKPGSGAPYGQFAAALAEKLTRLTTAEEPATATRLAPRAAPVDAFDIVAIGASTGGIHALSQLLGEVRGGVRQPILITQHLPASFMPYFAAQLARLAGRPCDVAHDQMRLRDGRIVIAPGDGHLRCVRLADGGVALRVSAEPAPSGCMPSVDPMLESVAAVHGARALAVVLSGMGRDGCIGARRVAEGGGAVVVQDRETSVVWGMPGAIAAEGLARAVLPPDAIGRLIATRRRPE